MGSLSSSCCSPRMRKLTYKDFELPIATTKDLDVFDVKLSHGRYSSQMRILLYDQVVLTSSRLGKKIKLLMRALFTKELISLYNWRGTKDKLKFNKKRGILFLISSVLDQNHEISVLRNKEFLDGMKKFFLSNEPELKIESKIA